MNRITSFTVDHDLLTEGIYVSRVDGDVVTYDLRMRRPNADDYLSDVAMHTFEHMFATFVRNSKIADDVLYFGPMGCQTGFYLLVKNADHNNVRKIVIDILEKIVSYNGDVFGFHGFDLAVKGAVTGDNISWDATGYVNKSAIQYVIKEANG